MPIYDYRCEACGHEFDDLRGFDDPDPEECPECGEDAVKKLITGGNFQLKGSGWYVTDYGDKKSGEKKAGATDSTSSESNSDRTAGESSSESTSTSSSSDSDTDAA